MVAAAVIRNRLEALEQGPGVQETKIFFIDGGSDHALTESQWEAVKNWEQSHPWGQAHVIVFEEVGSKIIS
ncbi:hypothetical protein DU38_05210 [Methanosarcina mazei]|uniref:Uncharacterized protein n=1 Tax=Methanosarcina mazei TaxID=2209 RepID=A0A0F8IF40_METMZ|nr:hypothetical protein [Methanosarcina mazei]KKG31040.1 hypothetical protein DU49_04240 [Methanosarcina mazei]KKG38800.1 hypothetical protein DU35_11435 [Methanosarcina mazei]KKG39393.1 hypothetical protein DU41_16175 [Methanosarcina mazei]KKG46986.1 hypothetical protein DU39_05065 [Methanosarcina mazei]KKG47792.1 hypothetical protein DU38_05210 [Methanosarcina mazei]